MAVRVLDRSAVGAACALSVEAGWNQVDADWRLFFDLGSVFGVHAPDGGLVATAAVLPYGRVFGWIGMVLVTRDARRAGIATQLVGHCIGALESRGLVAGLDATPAGREVYARIGFRDTVAITRLVRRASDGPAASRSPPLDHAVRAASRADLGVIGMLDRAACGGERDALLGRLLDRAPWAAYVATVEGEPAGFVLGRDGREATQLGPVVACDHTAAIALLGAALQRVTGAVYIDLLDRHGPVRAWLDARGFEPQRSYSRMLRGRGEPFGDPQRLVAIAGPEIG